jgi:hypothetical protein
MATGWVRGSGGYEGYEKNEGAPVHAKLTERQDQALLVSALLPKIDFFANAQFAKSFRSKTELVPNLSTFKIH